MSQPSTDLVTITASDIARLAGVGKAAVSNWRRRFPDFPDAVSGTASSPQFRLDSVQEWLARHGRASETRIEDKVWPLIRSASDELRRGELIRFLGAALLLHRDRHDDWGALLADPAMQWPDLVAPIRATLPGLPALSWHDDRSRVLPAVVDMAAALGHGETFEYLIARHQENPGRRAMATSAELARLMVDLAGELPNAERLLDPACGSGELLLAGHRSGLSLVIGVDVDPEAAQFAALRLMLHGVQAHVEAADSLRDTDLGDLSADLVVCDLPANERQWGQEELAYDPRWEFGLPPRGESELAWVQHCLSAVRPGGTVVVAMPSAVASRRPGRRIRGALLRAGALRAVISRPLASGSDLWVLCRPDKETDPPAQILLADAEGDPNLARAVWSSHLRGEPLPGRGCHVRTIELFNDEIDIAPARYLNRPGGTDASTRRQAYLANLAALRTNLDHIVGSAETLPVPGADAPEQARIVLSDLVKTGAVDTFRAPTGLTSGEDAALMRVLTVDDVRCRRAPSETTRSRADQVALRQWDIVVAHTGKPAAIWLLADAPLWPNAVLGPQLLLLRADPETINPEFLAGSLRASLSDVNPLSSWRTEVLRTALPRIPLSEQRRRGAAYRSLLGLEQRLAHSQELAARVLDAGFTGIDDGTLELDQTKDETQ